VKLPDTSKSKCIVVFVANWIEIVFLGNTRRDESKPFPKSKSGRRSRLGLGRLARNCRGGEDAPRDPHRPLPGLPASRASLNSLDHLGVLPSRSVPTRQSTTLLSKVNLPHVINIRAFCGANSGGLSASRDSFNARPTRCSTISRWTSWFAWIEILRDRIRTT